MIFILLRFVRLTKKRHEAQFKITPPFSGSLQYGSESSSVGKPSIEIMELRHEHGPDNKNKAKID
jgi:hypothetical protein